MDRHVVTRRRPRSRWRSRAPGPARSVTAGAADPPRGAASPPGRGAREVAAYDRSRAAAAVVSRHYRSPRAPPAPAPPRGLPPVPRPPRPRSGGIRPVDGRHRCHLPPLAPQSVPRAPPAPAWPRGAASRLRAGAPEKWRQTTGRRPPQVSSPATCPAVGHRERRQHRPATRGCRPVLGPPRPESGGKRPVDGHRRCHLPPLADAGHRAGRRVDPRADTDRPRSRSGRHLRPPGPEATSGQVGRRREAGLRAGHARSHQTTAHRRQGGNAVLTASQLPSPDRPAWSAVSRSRRPARPPRRPGPPPRAGR